MIKFLFALVFIVPLSFKKAGFWFNQIFYFMFRFMFMVCLGYRYQYVNVSYFFGYDMLSYVIVLLRF